MLVSLFQPKIFERIVCGKNGRLYRIWFAVGENAGRLYGRILAAEPVYEVGNREKAARFEPKDLRGKGAALHLPSGCLEPNSPLTAYNFRLTPSPYFLPEFFTSQMIRAPSDRS